MESSEDEESEKLFILHESASNESDVDLAESMSNLTLSNHPWRNLYLIAPHEQEVFSKCTLEDVQKFRDVSKNDWKNEKREENPSKVPRKTENSSDTPPSCPHAFYSVISSGAKFSVLTPIFEKIVSDDRQDLRIVHLDQSAKDILNSGSIKLQDYPVGRILCITKLQRKGEIDDVTIENFKLDDDEEENVLCSNAKYFWDVKEFFALPKNIAVNVVTAQKELEFLETLFDKKRNRKEAYQALQMIIELGSNGVFSVRNQMIDPTLYTTRISSYSEKDTYIYFNFNITKDDPKMVEKWNRSIRVMINHGNEKLAADVLDATDGMLSIHVRARSFSCPSEEMLVNDVIVQQKPEFEPKKVAYNVPEGSNADKLIQALYGGSPLPSLPKFKTISHLKFGSFTLLEPQTKYAKLMSDERIVALVGSSSFGCGKTATIAGAALYGWTIYPESFQIITAVTNCAIVAVIEKIEQFYPNPRIVRIISPENMLEIPPDWLTEYDYPKVLADLLKDVLRNEDSYDNHFLVQCIAYLKAKDALKEKSLQSEKLRILYRSSKEFSEEELLHYFMKEKRPSIIVGTVQSIIHAFFDAWESYSSKVVAVQIDESSTLNRESLIRVAIRFPHARFALVGDHRQLAPFCEREVSAALKEAAIGNTLEDCINKNFPSVFFNGVFRCRPEITQLLGDLFYDSKLVSLYRKCETEEQLRNFPLREIQNYPMVFIDTAESNQEKCGTSLKNEKEAKTAMYLADKLLNFVDKSKIAILCFYKAQIKEFNDWSQKSGVYVGSVDSGQGREWPICIICTTRTSTMTNCEFMIDNRRINVALSRSRHLNFVFGRKSSMDNAKNWKTIIRKCEIKDSLIKSNYLYRILNKEPVHHVVPKQPNYSLLDFPKL